MKEKVMSFFQEVISPKLNAFASNDLVRVIQAGMTAPMGAMIVGSIFTILQTPPVSSDATGVMGALLAWSQANAGWLKIGYLFTMDAIAIYTVIGIVVAFCRIKKLAPTNMIILSLMSFFILCCDIVMTDKGLTTITATFLGAKGLFSAIIVSCVVVYLSILLRKHGVKIKLPDSVPPSVAEPIENLIVNIVVVGVFIGLRLLLAYYGSSLPMLINLLFQPLLNTSDTLGAVVIYVLILRGLWFFGIHGGNVTGAIMNPILTANMMANIEAYSNGEAIPYIFTSSFANALLNVGMLPLVIAMLIVCRSAQLKSISKIGLIPAIFSIGEPITFGTPIVLNFKLVIPYMTAFLFDGVAYYLLTDWNFISRTVVNVPFTLPAPIKAFLCTLDMRTVVVWAVLMVINVLVFIPFLRSYDNDCLAMEQQTDETR